MVDGAALQNTSPQAAALAAGQTNETEHRGATLLDSMLLKTKGWADGVNRLAEDSVAVAASFSERFARRVSGHLETGKEWTEATREGMDSFGKQVEEKGDFKQWEKGTKERFPEALASVEQNGEWVENLAPLTAVGLVAEAEPAEAQAPVHEWLKESPTSQAQAPASVAAMRAAADIEDVEVAVDVVTADPAMGNGENAVTAKSTGPAPATSEIVGADIKVEVGKSATEEIPVSQKSRVGEDAKPVVEEAAAKCAEAAETPVVEMDGASVKLAAKEAEEMPVTMPKASEAVQEQNGEEH